MAKKEKEEKDLTTELTAITISENMRALFAKVIEQDGEILPDQIAELDALQDAMAQKFDKLCFVKSMLEAEAEHFKRIKEAADLRIKQREKAVENLKKYMVSVMHTANIKSVKGKEMIHSVSLVAGKTKVVIDDMNKLEFSYTELVTTVNPKKDLIKADLESGKTVSGAHLETGADFVMIR